MKPVSQEEYKAMQAKDWEWAKALIQCQIDDKRPGVQHLTNRPIINIKQMLESSAELYGDGIAFYGYSPYRSRYERQENCRNRRNHIYVGHRLSGHCLRYRYCCTS